MNITKYSPNLNGKILHVGIVYSRFNERFCCGLLNACIEELLLLNLVSNNIVNITVPGAFEIPLGLLKLAKSKQFNALIALGVVIRGETYHFQLVSNECSSCISRIILDYEIPIVNSLLTTENNDQAEKRMLIKGRNAARVAVEMANLAIHLSKF